MPPTTSSPREETLLGDIDHRGLDHFFRTIKTIPRIPSEELPGVYAKLRAGDQDARDRLILSNLLFAARIAYSFSRYFHVPVEDLFQEAILGLFKAAEKWDINRGGFLICAKHWMESRLHVAIAKYYRHASSTIAMEESLRHDATEDDAATIEDTIEAPDATRHTEATLTTHALLEDLTPQEREVIVLRYGLHGQDPLTGAEVGQVFGVSRQRISIIEINALETMRSKATGRPRIKRPRRKSTAQAA